MPKKFLAVKGLLERFAAAIMERIRFEEDDMALRRLCKSGSSARDEDCPAIYVDDGDPTVMVGQGPQLDAPRLAELLNRAPDESGIMIPTETVLRAAGLFLAERGRPAVLTEVRAYLAEADPR